MFSEFAAALGTGVAARMLAGLGIRQLIKFIPVYGQTAGLAASAATSFAVTYALGKAAVYFLSKRRIGSDDPAGVARAYRAGPARRVPPGQATGCEHGCQAMKDEGSRSMLYLRLAIVGIGLLLPSLTLIPFGSIWLWQNGYLLHWAIAACLAVLAAYSSSFACSAAPRRPKSQCRHRGEQRPTATPQRMPQTRLDTAGGRGMEARSGYRLVGIAGSSR